MAIEILCTVYSGPSRTGMSFFVVVGASNRYNPVSADLLKSIGLYKHIESLELFSTASADANMIFFFRDDYAGSFAQLSDTGDAGDVLANASGDFRSAMLVASKKQGTQETRLSFRSIFLPLWNSFLDSKLEGTPVTRSGNPTLTWEMFPASVSYLDSGLTYLKIAQNLNVSIRHWPDYSASMTYHVFLYADGNQHLRAWGARWACWVEGGLKTDRISDQLSPQVQSGLVSLQDQLNMQLQGFDAALGKVTDVYYLPGSQTTSVGTSVLTGNTNNDITIVIQH